MRPTASSTPMTKWRQFSPTLLTSTRCGADRPLVSSVSEVDPYRHGSRLQRLDDLGRHSPELASARHDIVIGSEIRHSRAPLTALSDTDIRVVGNVSNPTGASAVLGDDPRPAVVELRRNGNAARLTALATDGFQFGGHRGAQ